MIGKHLFCDGNIVHGSHSLLLKVLFSGPCRVKSSYLGDIICHTEFEIWDIIDTGTYCMIEGRYPLFLLIPHLEGWKNTAYGVTLWEI